MHTYGNPAPTPTPKGPKAAGSAGVGQHASPLPVRKQTGGSKVPQMPKELPQGPLANLWRGVVGAVNMGGELHAKGSANMVPPKSPGTPKTSQPSKNKNCR